jgi:hypothetical protein
VWQDYRNGSTADIYGARVSVGGSVLDPSGIAISIAGNDQLYPAISFDGANYLVVWEDYRAAGSQSVYGARVSSEGSVLDPSGISISTVAGRQSRPAIAFDGTNYLVVWGNLLGEAYDVYGTRVSVEGSVLDASGIAISTTAGVQSSPAIAFDGANYLVVWEDNRSGDTYDIYGARVSVAGSVLDASGIAVSTSSGGQSRPATAFDGTNYLVVWCDLRSGVAYDVYGSRVSVGGTVLDSLGIAILAAVQTQSDPAVAFDGTNYLVVWWDSRNGSTSDIYGGRVTAEGNVLDPSGLPVSTAANNQVGSAVSFDGTNYLVVWSDRRNSSTSDIHGARVSIGGSVLDPSGIDISTAAGDQSLPAISFDGTNYLVVWVDSRNSSMWDIYGARVSVGGNVLDPSGIPISTAASYQYCPDVAFDGTDHLVVWQDFRSENGYDTYGARVGVGGSVLDASGIAIATGAYTEAYPAVAFDGTNCLVAWQDYRSGSTYDIYGARVSVGGNVLDASGIAISTAVGDQSLPAISFDGANYLVVWGDSRSGSTADIYGARVSVVGSVLDASGIAVSTAAGNQSSPDLAFDGTDFLVVWQDSRSGSGSDIYGAHVSPGGIVIDAGGIAVSTADYDQMNPCVTSSPMEEVLISYQSFTTGEYNSYRIWGNMWEDDAGVDDKGSPADLRACQSYPNPFSSDCTIQYDIARSGRVTLKVFDVRGSLVSTLVDGWLEPGAYSNLWDGNTDNGAPLPPGVYFYSIKAGDFAATRKLLLLR